MAIMKEPKKQAPIVRGRITEDGFAASAIPRLHNGFATAGLARLSGSGNREEVKKGYGAGSIPRMHQKPTPTSTPQSNSGGVKPSPKQGK